MAKASIKELEALHNVLAGYYKEQLESGEVLSSGTLAAINAFLKNNDVKVDIVDADSPQNLTFKLKELMAQEG